MQMPTLPFKSYYKILLTAHKKTKFAMSYIIYLVLAKAHENMGNYDAGITAMEEALRISGGGRGLFEMDPSIVYVWAYCRTPWSMDG